MSTKTIHLGQVSIGANQFCVIAGPCSIESYPMLKEIAFHVKEKGAHILRGGIYKIRTSPQTFQGLGEQAIDYVKAVKNEANMPFIAEITDASQIEELHDVVDAFQVGTRNMHNTFLLAELGRTNRPVILKRGMSAYLKEWLNAAEYIARGGNDDIILCERGVRGFDMETRNILDIAGAVWAKQRSHYPVIIDPSHGTGRPELIAPMSSAAVAAGLDGIMVEVHPRPEEALSDGFQALDYPNFENVMTSVSSLSQHLGRSLQ